MCLQSFNKTAKSLTLKLNVLLFYPVSAENVRIICCAFYFLTFLVDFINNYIPECMVDVWTLFEIEHRFCNILINNC